MVSQPTVVLWPTVIQHFLVLSLGMLYENACLEGPYFVFECLIKRGAEKEPLHI